MKIISSPQQMQKEIRRLKQRGREIGFVPTMGALHAGHISLMKQARKENDIVVASIFVNTLQFGPKEDFKKYPRPFAADCCLLKKAKTDFVFHPSTNQMYPNGYVTRVEVDEMTDVLCGRSRPGHFRGVTTVVAKLFEITEPDRVYFGLKDYQQAMIITRMIEDLNMGIEMCAMPIVRERDGLAMSSRNVYLNVDERRRARVLSQTLFWMRDQLNRGKRQLAVLRQEGLKRLRQAVDKVDYLEIVDPYSLKSLRRYQPKMVILTACYVGKTRLIDNVIMPAS